MATGTRIGSSSRRSSRSPRTGFPCPCSTTRHPRAAALAAADRAGRGVVAPRPPVPRGDATCAQAGYDVVAVNPRETEIDGQPCYPTVADAVEATGPVDIVDVFRRADLCVEHAREAVAVGARCLWLQLGSRTRRPGGSPTTPGWRWSWTAARSSSTGASRRPEAAGAPAYWPLPAPRRRSRRTPCPRSISTRSPATTRPSCSCPATRTAPPGSRPASTAASRPAAGHVPSRPARVHGHGRRRPGLGPDDDDGRADDLDRGRGAAHARRDDVHPRRDHRRLRPDRDRRRGRRDGGRGEHRRRQRPRWRRGDRPDGEPRRRARARRRVPRGGPDDPRRAGRHGGRVLRPDAGRRGPLGPPRATCRPRWRRRRST